MAQNSRGKLLVMMVQRSIIAESSHENRTSKIISPFSGISCPTNLMCYYTYNNISNNFENCNSP